MGNLKEKFKNRFGDLLYADLRSLALMRVGIAVLLLIDLLVRWSSANDFYTDKGIFTVKDFLSISNWSTWSIHAINGSWEFQSLIFLISIIFVLMLLVGYKTKVATLLSFILLLSLHHRNLIVIDKGDALLRVILFWGLFIPWNARFSIDSIINKALKKLPDKFFSLGVTGYFVQICCLYAFASLYKTGPEWTRDFTAGYYALSSDLYSFPMAHFVLAFPPVLRVFTFCTRFLEITAPFLLFFPFYTSLMRMAAVALLISMHAGFGATLLVGLFPLIDIVVLFGLIPSLFWDKLFILLQKKMHQIKIYYDSDCGLCMWVVSYLKTFFLLPNAEIIPAHNNPEILKIMNKEQSWVIEDGKDNKFIRSKGVIPIIRSSPILFIFLILTKIPGIFIFGDKVYSFISKRRHSVCRIPPKTPVRSFRLDLFTPFNLIALFFIIFVVFLQAANFRQVKTFPLVPKIASAIGLDQAWNMFAPTPRKYTGWYVITGTLLDGREVNLLYPGKPISFDKPKNFTYKNYVWENLYINILLRSRYWYFYSYYKYQEKSYADYLCRKKYFEQSLKHVEIDFVVQKINLPESPKEQPVKQKITDKFCIE
jgi:hypothetical protein